MRRVRWGVIALLAVGACLLAVGGLRWRTERGPGQALEAFVQALKKGDAAAATSLLSPDQALLARRNLAGEAQPWEAAPELEHRIHRLNIVDDYALAEVWLSDQGYTIHPEFELERQGDGAWRITSISNLHPDPKWEQAEKKRLKLANELLAQELRDALKDAPSVLVRRPGDDPARRR